MLFPYGEGLPLLACLSFTGKDSGLCCLRELLPDVANKCVYELSDVSCVLSIKPDHSVFEFHCVDGGVCLRSTRPGNNFPVTKNAFMEAAPD